MYLKRIKLHGFKSFADRTELDFGPGMTCIVGPNGCGKSNVLDALRWVLGEQSAKTLRGSKMLDVVFSGSRSRLPANCAEVALTFDNSSSFLKSDASEVTVERLLFRSGESEYRMNGTVCRLKDIRDLFLDTGVGVDAYSIIEQGKVDALLSANPDQRREIFEEAAGVSRYKARRTEAQRRLERTQQNLQRLNDVTDELERQLRSVKLAAAKARKWTEYDQRLRELRSAVSLAEYLDLERSRVALSDQFSTFRDVLVARRSDLAARDADSAELAAQLSAADQLLRRAESELAALQAEAVTMTERATQARKRIADLEQTRHRLVQQAEELARVGGELAARIDEEAQDVAALVEAEQVEQQRIVELNQHREALLAQVEHGRRAVEARRREIFESARKLASISNERTNLEHQRQRLEAQRASLGERRERVLEQESRLGEQRALLDARLSELDGEVSGLVTALREAEAVLANLRTRIAEADRDISLAKEQRSGVLSRLRVLEDLETRREGVDLGTRWVLDWRGGGEGADGSVIGLVADVLAIDDPRVGLLQPILGQFENQPIVRDTHAFLNEMNRRGTPPGAVRALPLDRLVTPIASASYEQAPGFVARAIDWVSCSPEYQPLAQRLLGRVIVVDVTERALAMAADAPDGFIFVTLEGHVVEAGGAICVGPARAVDGLISRKAEIRQLRGELDDLEARLQHLQRTRIELDGALSDATLQRDSLASQVAASQRLHSETRTESLRLGDELSRIEREKAILDRDAAELERILRDVHDRFDRVVGEQAATEQAQHQHESESSRLEQELSGREMALAEVNGDLTAKRVELGRVTERRVARDAALADYRKRAAHVERQQAEVGRASEDALARAQAADAEIADAEARVAELNDAAASKSAEVAQHAETVEQLRRRTEASSTTVRLLHGEIEEVETSLRECEVSLRECEVKRDALTARVREELNIELASLATDDFVQDQDWAAQRAEIDELRGKIQRLGNVNLDAIAELEELTPRYDNLITQRTDLNTSIEQLQALIAELDQECMSRFTTTFEQVRANFQDLFRKLFGGGKADIVLEDAARPLECGIEVVARPPGKEPQSISLLSGGEKTMSTVALLFAIFKSRPSPFAFLDEVDAALDEQNVGRFNTMLGEFLEQSQFIVITHNKRTMQFADALYGVTMEEPGVSRRVSVRFDERVSTPNVA